MLLYLGTLINILLQVHDRHTSRVVTCFEISHANINLTFRTFKRIF